MVLFNLTITNCACKIFFIWRTHVRSTTRATPHFRTCEYAHLSLLMCCFYQQVAMYHTPRGWYFSTRAKIGIWGSPNQGRFQESGASILVTSNELEGLNALEAGFHVYPDLYKDNNVHFFTHWTKDTDRSTGCYNIKCGGFVPAEGAELTPGQAVAPASTYDGEDHYISISLHTDPNSGDWVLFRDDLEKPLFLGHFPKELCPKLNGGAPRMAWTGFVSYPKNEPSPAMGSGHFPLEGERKAA
ncbi:hypothetical protein EE612_038787 [Oryza sativa]|nr:hypothetical protein EE612_038787 [Oryza sativa]